MNKIKPINNLNLDSQERTKIISFESDNFHLLQFCKMKLNKWIYAPIIGTILYALIFNIFCQVNLIDKKKVYFNRIRLSLILFIPQVFLVWIFVAVLLAILLSPSLSNITNLNKIIYVLIPIFAILLISPFLSLLVKINMKKIVKVNKINLNDKGIKVYKNIEISNNKSYFEQLLKNRNHKINDFFLSDEFKNINPEPLTENYKGTKLERMKNYAQRQNEKINIVWFMMPLAFLIILLSRYFDYFFFSNLLAQKAKQDNKNSLANKIEWIIFFNYLFTLIFWFSFILFLVTPLTSFSYLSDNLLLSIQLHFVYCFIFLVIFMCLSLLRAQITKKSVIKLCLKYYSVNNY